MIRTIPLLIILLCGACTPVKKDISRIYPPPPEVPELSKPLKEECVALGLISDGSIKTLSETTATDAIIYAECKKRHSDVVEQYHRVKREQDSYAEQIKRFNRKQ